jgi:hypothetical protein
MLLLSACNKDPVNTDADSFVPPNVISPPYSFSRYDANGLLLVRRTFAYYVDPLTGLVETITKEATANFKNSPFDNFYSNAGSVSCQGKGLGLQANQSYLLSGSAANVINFIDTLGPRWEVGGNTATGITGFIYSTSHPLPVYKGVANNSIPSNISRANGTNIPLGANVEGADSIYVSITSGQKTLKKTVGGLSSKCEFSNTELSSLPASQGASALLQVSPVKFDISLQGGLKMYFANQSVYTKFIELK